MAHRLNPRALREYDIRGVVGRTLDADDAYAIGRGFATRVRGVSGSSVAVGRDGRTTSAMLEAALIRGLTEGGVDVVRIGLGPSPMLYWVEATSAVDGGVQVTGSHNPRDHNGFKLILQHASFFGDDIQDLVRLAETGAWSAGAGRVTERQVTADYVAALVAGATLRPFRIGWDAGNGAAGPAIEQLVQLLPGEHHLLFTDVDGDFPHHHPDPTEEANLADLKRLVAEKRLDFGLAFDGDGDRLGAVDGEGRALWGDQILSILAEPVLRRHPGAPIVADVKAGAWLFERIAALGGRAVMWKTGHSLMKAKMREMGAPLAGEMSGHLFFEDGWYGVDDALYAAVQLIRAVGDSGRSLNALRDALPAVVATPELRFSVAEGRRRAIVAEVLDRQRVAGARIDTVDGVRVTTDDGWWLLRASNTEDVLTARAEAADQAGLDRLVATIDAELAASGASRD